MYLQKVISRKLRKNSFFVGVLKVKDEKSRIQSRTRIRIRIHWSDAWNRGCTDHGSTTLDRDKGGAVLLLTKVEPNSLFQYVVMHKLYLFSKIYILYKHVSELEVLTLQTYCMYCITGRMKCYVWCKRFNSFESKLFLVQHLKYRYLCRKSTVGVYLAVDG
jgi:hypothetical protein